MAMCLSAQNSGLFTHTRGYFIKNGESWEEYLTSSRAGLWSSYSQYSEDANYYYISNSSCSVAVPKTSANSFYLRNGDDWDIVYQTRRVYGAFNDSGRDLYCHENGYFVREGNAWRLYLPEKRSGVWASFTTYREDDNFYYVSNSNDKMAIPKESANSFYLAGSDGEWNKSYTDTDIYFGGTGASSSGLSRNDDAEGLFAMGANYYLGQNGYEENHEKAFSYFKKAADAGNVDAQYMTGACYVDGDGVEADFKAAFSYFKKSADGGDSEGMSMVAKLYYGGEGVELDCEMAFLYALKAAEAGNASGQAFLGILYANDEVYGDEEVTGYEYEYEEKTFYWAGKAAAQDNVDGIALLAECYYTGYGVEKNEDKAYELYCRAQSREDEITYYFQDDYYYMKGMFEDDGDNDKDDDKDNEDDDDDFWWWLW